MIWLSRVIFLLLLSPGEGHPRNSRSEVVKRNPYPVDPHGIQILSSDQVSQAVKTNGGTVFDGPQWNGIVYRGDARTPAEIKAQDGFHPRPGPDSASKYSIYSHVKGNIEITGYVSTTSDVNRAGLYARNSLMAPGHEGKTVSYVYQIQANKKNYVGVNKSLRFYNVWSNQEHVAMDGIPWSEVKGYAKLTREQLDSIRDSKAKVEDFVTSYTPNEDFIESDIPGSSARPELAGWPEDSTAWRVEPWRRQRARNGGEPPNTKQAFDKIKAECSGLGKRDGSCLWNPSEGERFEGTMSNEDFGRAYGTADGSKAELEGTKVDGDDGGQSNSTGGNSGTSGPRSEGKKTTTGGVLSEGQGYNTFLGKGLLLDNVIFPSEAVAKRDALPAGEDDPVTAFNFTAPSANLSGIAVDEYFARPKHRTRPHSLAELKKHSNSTLLAVHRNFTLPAVQRRTADVSKCNAKIKTHYEFVEDYGHYLQALDVSASLTIAGWGQSASLSGTYLDQAKMSHDSITFVATIEIENDQKFPNGRFNLANYKTEDFTKTHGDRWVRGYSRGGKLSARLIFETSEGHDKEELRASAHAALRFWGISSDIDVEVKKAIEEVNKHTKVDVSLFQKGNLGKFRENKLIDKKALESVSASFAQLKEWADEFMEQACDHEFAFQPVLDEYTILPDFPQSQEIPDMDLLRLYANDLLHALVKASELSAALEREFETGGYPNFPKGRKGVRAMKRKFRGLVRESQKWTSQASIKVDSAEDDEEKVEDDIWAFIDEYKPLLQQAMAKSNDFRSPYTEVTAQ